MRLLQHILIAGCALVAGVVGAEAQEHIGSTALARNDVTRESAGASAPLAASSGAASFTVGCVMSLLLFAPGEHNCRRWQE